LEIGAKIKGVVRMTKDYGVFVDIGMGRRDALMPGALLGEGVEPEQFEANQEGEAYVASIDANTERVTLSYMEPPEEGFASPGRRRKERKQGEDHLEERLLSRKYVTILRMTIMTTLNMRTTTITITMTRNLFRQAQPRSHPCLLAQLDVLDSRPQLPRGAPQHPLFTLHSINSLPCHC